MRLFDLLMTVEPATIVSVQFHEHDTESYCALKEAQDFTVGESRLFKVKYFYPERYNSMHCIGITVIVEEAS